MTLTLIFDLDTEAYGLEISAVQEVLEDPPRHFVPQATGVLTSAINFHGQILPLIDLPRLLGFHDPQRDHRKIVLTPEYHSLVFEVSGVQRIIPLDLALLQPAPVGSGQKAVRGVVACEDLPLNLLDIEQVIHMLQKLYTK